MSIVPRSGDSARVDQMNNFDKAFESGRIAVRKQRTPLLLAVCAFMGVAAALQEHLAHSYLIATFALAFFLVVLPWFGWAWIKPKA